jgi:hypothetical protein
VALIHGYCVSQGHEDNPWFYNERATLSTLAGAAWRLKGWIALEEFSTQKWAGRAASGGVESGELRSGRCDLHVANRTSAYAVEAKQAWQPIGQPAEPYGRVDEALVSAKRDARTLTVDEADVRIAAVFAVPFLPVSRVQSEGGKVDQAKVLGKVTEWLRHLKDRQHDAIAYYFTPHCSAMISADGKRLFPGVLLTLDICRRAKRA